MIERLYVAVFFLLAFTASVAWGGDYYMSDLIDENANVQGDEFAYVDPSSREVEYTLDVVDGDGTVHTFTAVAVPIMDYRYITYEKTSEDCEESGFGRMTSDEGGYMISEPAWFCPTGYTLGWQEVSHD